MSSERVTNVISPRQAEMLIPIVWKHGLVPNLVGKTSSGKTSCVKSLAERMKKRLIESKKVTEDYVALSINYLCATPPEELGGLPVRNEALGKAETLAFKNLPWDRPKKDQHGTIVFWDEGDRVHDLGTLNGVQNIILEKRFHDHTFDENVFQVMAMNGETDEGTMPLPDALRGRLVHLYICPSAKDYDASFEEWIKRTGRDERLIEFRKACPPPIKPLYQLALDEDRKRVWASELWNTATAMNLSAELKAHLVFGCIGETVGRAFIAKWSKPTRNELLAMSANDLRKLDPKLLAECCKEYGLKASKSFTSMLPPEVLKVIGG